MLARRGIDAAAVRKIPADDGVVVTDDGSQRADGEDDRERGKARGDEGETDDVGLARAPIAIKQSGGALPIDVAGAMSLGGKFGHVAEFVGKGARRVNVRFAARAND